MSAIALEHLDYSRRFLSAPAFDHFLPLPLVGTPDEPALTYATKALDTKTDAGAMTATGQLTVEEPDRAREILVLDGMDLSGFQRNPIGLFQHDRFKPVGRFVDKDNRFTVLRRGKSVEGTLHFVQSGPHAELAAQVFGLVETKLLNGWSPGFMSHWKDYRRVDQAPGQPGTEPNPETSVVRIEKWRPFEWSLVFVPENDRSLVTQVVRKGLSMGSGYKSLLPPLLAMLAPYAEPSVEWAPGVEFPQPNSGTVQPTEGTKEVSTPAVPAAPTVEVKEVIKEVVPDAVKQLADRGAWYDRFVGQELSLPIGDYTGKPGQKALRAVHDVAMMTSAAILRTLEEIDGPAEAAIAQAARDQQLIAANCVEKYKTLYGEVPEWAAVSAAELYEYARKAGNDPTEQVKSLGELAKGWAARTKGWGKHHATRCSDAATLLGQLAASDKLTADERTRCQERAKALSDMVAANGSLTDLETEWQKELDQLKELVERANANNKQLQSKLERARLGQAV